MNANTKKLHDMGQSLWVGNISREMLMRGTLSRYIADWSVTGLTSNPTTFEHAIAHGGFYDEPIARLARRNEPAESSGASWRGGTRTCAPWPRSSSAAGTWR